MGVGATLTSDPDASHARLPERHGATAANEVIMGWLEGVADGCPELCVEFPYLRGDDEVAPLTVAYTLGAQGGSRGRAQPRRPGGGARKMHRRRLMISRRRWR
jgi:hypothetical protein